MINFTKMEKASLKKYFTHMDLDNSGKNRIFKIGRQWGTNKFTS